MKIRKLDTKTLYEFQVFANGSAKDPPGYEEMFTKYYDTSRVQKRNNFYTFIFLERR